MNTCFRKLGLSVLAITLAGVIGGCDDHGGLIRLFFGTNGVGDCDQVTVTIRLDAANALVARDSQGVAECTLASGLAADGCTLNLTEGEGELVATISNCTIPAVSNLISCLFKTADISEIQAYTSAQCECQAPGCIVDPPVCVSHDANPTSCENCTNGIDDDHNGYTDCQDPNCSNKPVCNPGPTTTTSSSTTTTIQSSTTTSTTITTTTTSTTIPLNLDCTLVFRLNDGSTVGALQWDTDYNNAPGQFVGSAGNVECSALPGAGDVIFVPNDKENLKVLTIGMTGTTPFTGPANIAECRFKASVAPETGNYSITVVDAADGEGTPISPLPPVIISSINCSGPTTTTTTEQVTTTTDTTTTTVAAGGKYIVTFSQTNATTYGALQLEVNYSGAPGGFTGTGSTVVCTKLSAAGSAAYNDNEGTKKLGLGWISADGSTGPQTLAVCDFDATATPVVANFPVTIKDVADINGEPVTVTIGVAVALKP